MRFRSVYRYAGSLVGVLDLISILKIGCFIVKSCVLFLCFKPRCNVWGVVDLSSLVACVGGFIGLSNLMRFRSVYRCAGSLVACVGGFIGLSSLMRFRYAGSLVGVLDLISGLKIGCFIVKSCVRFLCFKPRYNVWGPRVIMLRIEIKNKLLGLISCLKFNLVLVLTLGLVLILFSFIIKSCVRFLCFKPRCNVWGTRKIIIRKK